MNTPLFTGEYRKKPIQSLGGATKSDTKDDLLEKNRKQRLLREHRRHEEQAATRIQAFYRGSQSRRLTQCLTRQRFDQLAASIESGASVRQDFLLMAKCLNNFYLSHLDNDRVVQLASLYVKHHREISEQHGQVQQQQQHPIDMDTFAVGKFLSNTLIHLSRLGQHSDSASYSTPLRALELAMTGDCCRGALRQYLAEKGYFVRLTAFTAARCGLTQRADLSDAISQPLVRSLCQLIMLPLAAASASSPASADQAAVSLDLARQLIRQTLCDASLTPRVTCHLVGPMLASATSRDSLLILSVAVEAAATPGVDTGPGLLHLLACRSRQMLAAAADATTTDNGQLGRLIIGGIHRCRPCVDQLPADLAAEVADGLASDWFSEMLRAAFVGDGGGASNQQSQTSAPPPAESFVHLSSVCALCPSLTLYTLTPAGPPRTAFLQSFWQAITQFQQSYPVTQTQQHQHHHHQQLSLFHQISRGVQPDPAAMSALQPLLAAFSRLFSPDSLPRRWLLQLSGELRDLMLGLLLLSHPDTRPDLLNADYVRALKSLGGDAGQSASSEAAADSSVLPPVSNAATLAICSSRHLLDLYSGLFHCVKPLVSRLFNLDQLCRFTAQSDDPAASSHWSVQGRVPPIKSLQPSYWLERDVSAGNSFGYYSVLNDAVSIPYLSSTERLQLAILTEAPYLISFWDRVRLLYSLLQAYKAAIDYDRHEFGSSGIRVTARRDKIYEDAFSQLYGEENLYPRLKVAFRNELGLEEAGIDGGGLMREFLALVLSAAFDPERGFYSQTAGSGALYPNPLSPSINPEYSAHYYFHGKLLGKLLFERLLIDLPLAPFFLRRIIASACSGGDGDAATLDELAELDAELYKNVSALSSATADELDAMELDFSIAEDRLGRSETVELKPGGSLVRVRRDNVSEYQQLLADYKLRRQIAPQALAFARGLVSVIPCPDWLGFFSHNELQLLISGSDSPIDVLDLRKHTAYQGCSVDSETVVAFWRLMLDEFTERQRRLVLRFVTSLTRAPLYGWRELQPPFTVVLVPETDRLPSSSTCINLLKLPDYRNPETLRQKLLMAVESNSGFELS